MSINGMPQFFGGYNNTCCGGGYGYPPPGGYGYPPPQSGLDVLQGQIDGRHQAQGNVLSFISRNFDELAGSDHRLSADELKDLQNRLLQLGDQQDAEVVGELSEKAQNPFFRGFKHKDIDKLGREHQEGQNFEESLDHMQHDFFESFFDSIF